MDTIEIVIFFTFIAELIEFIIFYSPILGYTLHKSYTLFQKSPFLLFAAHINYIWILIISLTFNNLSLPIIFAISLKTLDIFTKIELIKIVYIKQQLNSELNEILNTKIPLWIYLLSLLTYPYLVYLAFS